MRASVASLSTKLLSIFFMTALIVGLMPVPAFAAADGVAGRATAATGSKDVVGEAADTAATLEDPAGDAAKRLDGSSSKDDDSKSSNTEDGTANLASDGIINQEMPLDTVIAQAESTRSFFLAQTLESTKTIPVVSAKLHLDTTGDLLPSSNELLETKVQGDDGSEEDGMVADESAGCSEGTDFDDSSSSMLSESIVTGSFVYGPGVYAVDSDEGTVTLVAVDPMRLDVQEHGILMIPAEVTSDGDSFSVVRIAASCFSAAAQASGSNEEEASVSADESEGVIAEEDAGSRMSDFLETDGDSISVVGIPTSVRTIEEGAFGDCPSLQWLEVEEGNASYSSYNGVLYDADRTSLLLIPEGRQGVVRIPQTAASIDPEVFSHCPSVTSISVDAGNAVFSSENGCLYDAAKTEVLFVPTGASEDAIDSGTMLEEDSVNPAFLGLYSSSANLDGSTILQTDTRLVSLSGTVSVYGNGGGFKIDRRPIGSSAWVTYSDNQTNFSLNASMHRVIVRSASTEGYMDIESAAGDWFYCLHPVRSGYYFAGWAPATTGNLHANNIESSNAGVYYARWYPSVVCYGNGGTVSASKIPWDTGVSSTAVAGVSSYSFPCSSYMVPANGTVYLDDAVSRARWIIRASRNGYSFLGWGASASATSNVPTSSTFASALDMSTISYYARWSRNTYSLTYDTAGGDAISAITYNVDMDDFVLPVPTRIGYTFTGWTVTGALGTGATNSGTTTTVKKGTYGDITAKANWRAIDYSIAYDTNGGDAIGQASYTIATSDFVLPTPVRTGYTFTGWNVVGMSGVGVAGNGTTSVTVRQGTYGDLAAKANWSMNTYHLSWNVAHGSHANRTTDFTVDDCPIQMSAAIADVGYAFNGWSGAGISNGSSSFVITSAMLVGTLDHAVFSYTASIIPNDYRAILHANDGTGDDGLGAREEHAVTFDAAVAAVAVPKLYGYVFSGYWTRTDDGSKDEQYFDASGTYIKDTVWKDATDVELYAAWTLIGSLEVPITAPSTVSFAVDRATGLTSALDGSAFLEGSIRSAMPEEVPVSSLALERLADSEGFFLAKKVLGADNLEKCAMEVVFSPSEVTSHTAIVRFASPVDSEEDVTVWEFSPGDAPVVPAAIAAPLGSMGDDIVADGLGNLARAGELPLTYALKTLPGFDVYEVPLADATSEPVARIVFTVDLTGLVHERF